MIQSVDSLHFTSNVELFGLFEKVLDGRVLLVSSKHFLRLHFPMAISQCFATSKIGNFLLVWLVHIVHLQNSEISVVTEVA